MSERGPVLVVGRGLIGSATAQRLRSAGRAVVTVGRSGAGDGHLPCDLSTPDGRRELRDALHRLRPRCAVLTHGPSDVTWIEAHEAEAAAVHHGVAALLAGSGVPAILISTDNVFPGDAGGRTPRDPIRPDNAYGRVKARAEAALLSGDNLVLRVSLVYGWTTGHRTTYGQRCVESALRGEVLDAPVDQSFTPVHVDDVARVVTALCLAPVPPSGIAHLAGPEELSRHDFAAIAYRLAGADPALVRPCRRCDTHWASRPRYSSLACDDLAALTGLPSRPPMSPARGLRLMLATAPSTAVAP